MKHGGMESALEKINVLETRLKLFTDMYGPDPKTDIGLTLKEYQELISKLEAKCEFYHKTESTLLSEIETIGSA